MAMISTTLTPWFFLGSADENVPYDPYGPNSNSFAQDLATGTPMGGTLPQGVPGPDIAPGIDKDHPNFP